jgi:hypothetical protein
MGLVHFSLAQHENLWGYLLHLVAYNSEKKKEQLLNLMKSVCTKEPYFYVMNVTLILSKQDV